MIDAPLDATHYSDFYGVMSFWKKGPGLQVSPHRIIYHGVESGNVFYSWYSWDVYSTSWRIETGVNSDRLKKIENAPA